MLKVHELFLTFFYFGKSKIAPGTAGSFVGLFFWLCFTTIFCGLEIPILTQNIFWISFLIIAFAYGSVAAPLYAKQFDQIDHQTIVLDEVVGEIIALQCGFVLMHKYYFQNPNLIAIHLMFCFFVFRFFDIKKPSLIGHLDRNYKNGVGVMLDDAVAGFATAVAWIILYKLTLVIR